MNAFKFKTPDSKDPMEWRRAVGQVCASQDVSSMEVAVVLREVSAAVHAGKVGLKHGDVHGALEFANAVLGMVRQVDDCVTAWQVTGLVPPSVALFVQATQDDRFVFQPMFTL